MTIDLQPEVEALLLERMKRDGLNSVDEVLVGILQAPCQAVPSRKQNFADFLLASPLPGSGLELEKSIDFPRAVEL